MLNGRKTILLVEIAGRFLSGTDYQTTANFAGGRQYRPALFETVIEGNQYGRDYLLSKYFAILRGGNSIGYGRETGTCEADDFCLV